MGVTVVEVITFSFFTEFVAATSPAVSSPLSTLVIGAPEFASVKQI